jgi:hypothetical protein
MKKNYRTILYTVFTAFISMLLAPCVTPVFAYTTSLRITNLAGTADPITYTDSDGTFTTSPIDLTLSARSPSIVTVNTDTGTVSDHTVMKVLFNNGKPGELNTDLSGVFTIDESGTLTPCSCTQSEQLSTATQSEQLSTANLVINSAKLSGAGEFNGTNAKGHNMVIIRDSRITLWTWGNRFTGTNDVLIDLPSTFSEGTNIPIAGYILASMGSPSDPAINSSTQ